MNPNPKFPIKVQSPDTRILFYGDYSETHIDPVQGSYIGENLRGSPWEFGLAMLKEVLETPVFPKIHVDFINRFFDFDGPNPSLRDPVHFTPLYLTKELLDKYDQVWFFGQHLGSYSDDYPNMKDSNGFPQSELTSDEVDALFDWMNAGGGVLITGDHANIPATQPDSLYSLGRAMGHKIKRAGSMRVWEQGPGADLDHGQVNTSGDDQYMYQMPNQADGIPQNIDPLIWEINLPYGGAEIKWHPLFSVTSFFDMIRIMPDHGHEGAIQILSGFDEATWPSGSFQPKPVVVATGVNKNNQSRVNLVAAYDGHAAGVGRIVAHSTWHHFVNVNLNGFRNGDGSPSASMDTISRYYINLAWYLSREKLLKLSMKAIIHALENTSNIRDLRGTPLKLLGQAAFLNLSTIAAKGQITDLIHFAVARVIKPEKDHATEQLFLPEVKYLLGGIIAEKQGRMKVHHAGEENLEDTMDVAAKGIIRGIQERLSEIEAEAGAFRKLLSQALDRSGQPD